MKGMQEHILNNNFKLYLNPNQKRNPLSISLSSVFLTLSPYEERIGMKRVEMRGEDKTREDRTEENRRERESRAKFSSKEHQTEEQKTRKKEGPNKFVFG